MGLPLHCTTLSPCGGGGQAPLTSARPGEPQASRPLQPPSCWLGWERPGHSVAGAGVGWGELSPACFARDGEDAQVSPPLTGGSLLSALTVFTAFRASSPPGPTWDDSPQEERDPAPADSSRGQAIGLLGLWAGSPRGLRPRALWGAGVVVSVRCEDIFGVLGLSPSIATGGDAWHTHRPSDSWPPADPTHTWRRGCSLRGAWGGPPQRRNPRTQAPRLGRTRWRLA